MIFQIHKHIKLSEGKAPTFSWTLDYKDGRALVRSPHDDFASEEAVRSNIAEARKSLKGASFAKVQSAAEGCTTSV